MRGKRRDEQEGGGMRGQEEAFGVLWGFLPISCSQPPPTPGTREGRGGSSRHEGSGCAAAGLRGCTCLVSGLQTLLRTSAAPPPPLSAVPRFTLSASLMVPELENCW